MPFGFLIKGIIVGFSIAAPVGPIGVLCVRRSVAHGRLIGLLSGLGAATADAGYGLVAAFGLTAVSKLLIPYQPLLRLIGGGFLCYLGVVSFLSKPAREAAAAPAKGEGPLGAYASTVLLTLMNPMTILAFAAVFAGVGLGARASDYVSAASLVGGVFVGSALWWLALSSVAASFRSRLSPPLFLFINKTSGVIIGGFGLYELFLLVLGSGRAP